jgi:hypothetical protein
LRLAKYLFGFAFDVFFVHGDSFAVLTESALTKELA